jgi:multidrug efflux pump subunit AcrB
VLKWSNGTGIRLGDVATVSFAATPAAGAASIMGAPGVLLMLESQYGTNTLSVTKALEGTLAALKPVLAKQGIELHSDIFRPASFVDAAISHLRTALLVGAALVAAHQRFRQ